MNKQEKYSPGVMCPLLSLFLEVLDDDYEEEEEETLICRKMRSREPRFGVVSFPARQPAAARDEDREDGLCVLRVQNR